MYAEKDDSAVDRLVRWLVAPPPLWAKPGETVSVNLHIPTRLLAYWNNGRNFEAGSYQIRAASPPRIFHPQQPLS